MGRERVGADIVLATPSIDEAPLHASGRLEPGWFTGEQVEANLLECTREND